MREGVNQQHTRIGLGDAARAQVEQSSRIELTDRRAMAALDVVGVDLELGLRVELGSRREQEITAGLMRIGLLRARMDQHLAVEDSAPASVCNAAVVLGARSMRRDVLDERVRIEMLGTARRQQPVEVGMRTRLLQAHANVEAAQRRT